jgi:hypothetical protein
MEKKAPAKKIKKPCWKGYEMRGLKSKNGKLVPNCIKIKERK